MKKQFSFSRLLHKDKLMMLISLILAIIIWAVVDSNQGYEHTMDFTVPVKVETSEFATGLRVSGRTPSIKFSFDIFKKDLCIVRGLQHDGSKLYLFRDGKGGSDRTFTETGAEAEPIDYAADRSAA